jgi:hypothetical protein
MKTIILFSSIFYLLGLKLGGTLTFFRHLAGPVKTVISLPVEKPEKTTDEGKSYFFQPEKTARDVKSIHKDSLKVTLGKGLPKPSATTSGKQKKI